MNQRENFQFFILQYNFDCGRFYVVERSPVGNVPHTNTTNTFRLRSALTFEVWTIKNVPLAHQFHSVMVLSIKWFIYFLLKVLIQNVALIAKQPALSLICAVYMLLCLCVYVLLFKHLKDAVNAHTYTSTYFEPAGWWWWFYYNAISHWLKVKCCLYDGFCLWQIHPLSFFFKRHQQGVWQPIKSRRHLQHTFHTNRVLIFHE